MSERLEQSIKSLLAVKTDCLKNIVTEFDEEFLNKMISLFETVESSDFSTLSPTQNTKLSAKFDALSQAIRVFNDYPKGDKYKASLKNAVESLRSEFDGLDIDKSKPLLESSKGSPLGVVSDIKQLSDRLEQESQKRAEDFANFYTTVEDIKYKLDDMKPAEELKDEAMLILDTAKEALNDAQKTKIIEFSGKLYIEYEKLEDKYFWTGAVWQVLAVASFVSILCVLFYYEVELSKAIVDTNGSIGNSFVFSVYALNPVFAKIGLIIFFGAMAGVCLRIYSEYKRLSQEYRQKSLLAKNLLTGHEVLKPYIGDKIDTAFILPTIEKMLEDPLTKVYSSKESKEDALGLVEKIMELGKKGKELGSEKAKGD